MAAVRVAHLLLCLITSLCLATGAQAAEKPRPAIAGDSALGKIKSEDNRCQECHGPDGNGQGPATGAAGKFAKLAGQYPDYMLKQIREFRTGERKHDLMLLMAKSIDDEDAIDIAAYFSSQKKMQGDGSGNNPIGKNLYLNGDPGRNILPCGSCHGLDGKGLDIAQQTIPVIGGQEWHYLEKQLLDWRSGERHNSAAGIMNTIAKPLTDAEILALTNYISGL
ncbi:MAG TPA: c-type cytochrome [Cellvibrio sp.]|nr:c-type cytochrome [Cellvibrio sp.]